MIPQGTVLRSRGGDYVVVALTNEGHMLVWSKSQNAWRIEVWSQGSEQIVRDPRDGWQWLVEP